jgi:hypothetical protein
MKRSIATLSSLLLMVLGCTGTDPDSAGGARVLLTDAPFPFDLVQSVNIHIVSVAASAETDTTVVQRDWVTVAEPDKRFDLLELQQGKTAIVADGDLPADQYKAVRLVIDTDRSDIILQDGSEATVQWPVHGELALHALVEVPFWLLTGPIDSDIVIDFDVGRSFQYFDGRFVFIPWIRAVIEAATGTLTGTVRGTLGAEEVLKPVPGAIITVYNGNPANRYTWWVVATTRSDADGNFSVHYLSGGDYIVEAVAPASSEFEGVAIEIDVVLDAGTEVDVPLTLGVSDVTLPEPRLLIQGPTTLVEGYSGVLQAVRLEADGDTLYDALVDAQWLNGNPAVLKLEGTGTQVTITGLTPGTAQVFATDGVLSDSVVVHVVEDTTSTASMRREP